VPAEDLPQTFGFIMEEIGISEDGSINRRFIRLGEAMRKMVSGKERIYTKDLKNHPSEYAREMEVFKKAGLSGYPTAYPFSYL